MSKGGMFFILEHSRRGTFTGFPDNGSEIEDCFEVVGGREENVFMFESLSAAWSAWEKIPPPTKFETSVLVYNPKTKTFFKLFRA